jgi:PLP dependent protein
MPTVSSQAELQQRLDTVRARIAEAAHAAGRDPASITLIAVSKTQSAQSIRALAALGQRDFGENYLQEALGKINELRELGFCWHFIGQLQTNKTRSVAENFDWVHTIDRAKVAERLSAQRPFHAPALQVCIQVKLAEEETKGGCTPQELPELVSLVASLPKLQLRGLMAVPPATDDPAQQRQWFKHLHDLMLALQADYPSINVLSMGMSEDLEAAIREGSTHIRVGTALFGARQRLQSNP